MPYDVGQGIAEGTNNFFRMYMMQQEKKKQQKLEEVQPVIDAISLQLKDKTTPIDSKKKLINQLENVYKAAGIKIRIPKGQTLAEMILPEELVNQIQDTGETETAEAINAIPEGMHQPAQEDITTSVVQTPIARRRGELSQAEIELGLERKARRGVASDDAELQMRKQKEFALFQYNLNQQIQSNAYAKNPEEVVEPKTGRTWSVYTNPNPNSPPIFKPLGAYRSERGELITQPEENTIPVSTYTARERAKGAGGGLPATMKALIFETSRELGLPQDDETVLNTAAEKYRNQYQARTNNLNLGTTKGEQATQGKEPIQPVERERLDLANRQLVAELEGQIDGANTTIQAEDAEINSYQAEIDQADAELKRLLEVEKYYKEDDEVKAAQKRKDDLVRLQNTAKRRKASAEGIQNRAKKKLETLSPSSTSRNDNGLDSEYTPQILKMINAFRSNPKNKAKGADKMDDAAIYDILKAAGRL